VDVFERHADAGAAQTGPRSALNITLCERGLWALEPVGMRQTILDLAVPARGRKVHSLEGDIAYQPYGNHGEAIYSISRADLNRALIERARRQPRVRFHFEAKLMQLDVEKRLATFQGAGGERHDVKAERLFGTDGAYSAVRSQLQRVERLNYSQQYWRHGGYKSLWVPARADGTPALEGEALHVWPRGSRMLMGFPNRDGSAMLSLLLPFEGTGSYQQLCDEPSLRRFFREQFGDVVDSIPALNEQFFTKPPNPLVTVRCDPWSHAGRILLLGDAAHALLPSYGQGANAGFEDCLVLDRCLDEHGEDWDAAFRAFEAARRPALDMMSELCIEHFEELTDHVADPEFLKRREAERALSDLYPDLYQPLYSMVSFSRLPYDEAIRIELRRRDAVDQIMKLPDLDAHLASDRVRQLLEESAREPQAEPSPAVNEPRRDTERHAIFELGMSFWSAKALLSAVELGVFSALSSGPLGRAELSARVGLHARGAADFLDALTAMGLLVRSNDCYSLTPNARQALTPEGASYVGGALELANARLYPVWSMLSAALRSGQPQNEAQHSKDYYGNLTQSPERLRNFLAGMSDLSRMAVHALIEKFPWQEYGSFADVGGAQGLLPVQLAKAYPHLRGINFELPPVKPIFEQYVRAAGVQGRLRFQTGDFFSDPLPSVDVIVMGHVLHNWGLAQKRMLVAKAYQALPPRGALVVYEALIDDARQENAFGLLMSLNMLLVTAEGFVFTGGDCQGWMREAGFSKTYVKHLHGPDSMVVAIK
jgi:2-polyprenyl-6-methoxyphenol hydroxylase-like FAD-dependent oxidoreductase